MDYDDQDIYRELEIAERLEDDNPPIPTHGEQLDVRTAPPKFVSRLNYNLAVQDILDSLRAQCAEYAPKLNVKPQTLLHSVLDVTHKEKKSRQLTTWQAIVHLTREELSECYPTLLDSPHLSMVPLLTPRNHSPESSAALHSDANSQEVTNPTMSARELFAATITEAKKRRQQNHWPEAHIERVRQELETRRTHRQPRNPPPPPRTTDARRFAAKRALDAFQAIGIQVNNFTIVQQPETIS